MWPEPIWICNSRWHDPKPRPCNILTALGAVNPVGGRDDPDFAMQ
jgi:hypothetical protein